VTTLSVEKVIHVNQVLGDFAGANRFYADVFGAREYMNNYDEGEDRDASLFVIGDTCIELFSPRGPGSLLGRNLARFGDSWHSFEWKVSDLEEASTAFETRGVRVTTYRPGSFFMTHPKDGHGLLFELCPDDMANDPRVEAGWTPAWWRDEHPLGIDRLHSVGAAVGDLDAAAAFLSDLTATDVLYRTTRPGVGEVAGLFIGDTCIELVQPDGDASPVAAYIERYGPRVRSLQFRVRDVGAVCDHFARHGLRTRRGDGDGWVALEPDDNYGVLYQFTEEPLPDDPRGA
jgi:catechol 2,3-dioxygenase-like lactoylglutathione lyase family enzyme